MTRIALTLCIALAVTCNFHAALAADDAATHEMERLAGVWSFSQVKVNGKAQPAGHEADRMIIQKDGRYAVVQRRGITHGTMQVDPGHSPKHYDVEIASGPMKGMKVSAIYELSGDTLTMCMPLGKPERPAALESKAGDHQLFEVFKREPQGVKEALVAAGRRELTGTWQSVSYALEGKKASEDDLQKVQLVFDAEGDTKALNDGNLFIASKTMIDPTANPATIDITFTGGEGKGGTALGIYKIEDGVLTICRSAPGKPRPAEFKSEPGSGLTLMSYKPKPRVRKFRSGAIPNGKVGQ